MNRRLNFDLRRMNHPKREERMNRRLNFDLRRMNHPKREETKLKAQHVDTHMKRDIDEDEEERVNDCAQ